MNRHCHDDDLLDLAIRESRGGRLATAIAATVTRAWPSSRLRRLVTAAVTNWRTLGAPQKIRTGALAGAVAMAVHRMAAWLGPAEPLGAVLPFFVFVACAMMAVLAAPIARAGERLKR